MYHINFGANQMYIAMHVHVAASVQNAKYTASTPADEQVPLCTAENI